MDVSMVYRAIPAAYRSLLGNAFTESTEPNNETGFYLGFSFRPFPHWQLDAYIDQFRFPWLKWLLDAPGNGSEWMGQLSFIQRKKMELNMRLSHWRKPVYQSSDNVIGYPVPAGRTNWRIQIEQKLNERVTLRSRVECSWFKKESDNQETGYSVYGEISWRPARKKYLFNGRIQRFETGSYDSRIYAYEKDVLYSQAVPAFSGKGYRYYFNLQLDLFKNLAIWVRWAQTRYDDISGIGSGPEFIEGDRKSEIKLQLVYSR
jgi:hypothetical protein